MGFWNQIFTNGRKLPIRPRLLVSDFDGVMTDNTVLVSEEGKESVFCNRADGWGIQLLKEKGISTLVLSTERNRVVQARCKKMKIPCYQNSTHKLRTLRLIAKKYKILLKEMIYVGNDTNDLDCLRNVGLSIVVADAHPTALNAADIVLKHKGGKGAIREVCEIILQSISGKD